VNALDTFKRTGRRTLPVYRKDTFLGRLTRETLLNFITRILGETGQD
jgi:hypothetical protein